MLLFLPFSKAETNRAVPSLIKLNPLIFARSLAVSLKRSLINRPSLTAMAAYTKIVVTVAIGGQGIISDK